MFQEKASKFWTWFMVHERVFRHKIDHQDYENINSQIKEKLQEILPEVVFEITHQHDRYIVELMPMGNSMNRLMMLSLILCKPITLKQWEFYNYRLPKKGTLNIKNMLIDGDDIVLIPRYDSKENRFQLKVLCDKLKHFDDDEKFSIFYLLLYEYMGEILSESVIAKVEFITDFSYRVRYQKQEQCTLTKLRSLIIQMLGSSAVQKAEEEALIYEAFSGKPDPLKKGYRHDIVSGYSALMEVCAEYYDSEQPIITYLKQQGIHPYFLHVDTIDNIDNVAMLVKEKIKHHGIMTGISQSLYGNYIDFVLYDELDVSSLIKTEVDHQKMIIQEF